ncbi:MAG: hypothetical protein IKP19_09740 [Oscillospiraceae bacterium]|nr:hypothetical protein [Oscillospiraceae bacterium]
MSESNSAIRFRNALHGFNRDDVVSYIDSTAKQHEAELRQAQEQNLRLQRQLDEANQIIASLRASEDVQQELDAAKERISRLLQDNEALAEQVNTLEEALANAPKETEVPEVVTQDLTAPIPAIQEVLPVEVAPSKDYTELELAAYRRAELAERVARERAADVYREVNAVFTNATSKMDGGRQDLEQMTRTIQADVNQLMNVLAGIRSAYDEAEVSFNAVNEKNRQLTEGV